MLDVCAAEDRVWVGGWFWIASKVKFAPGDSFH